MPRREDAAADATTSARSELQQWFTAQGWEPHPFQRRAWRAFEGGSSSLIHVPTGAGKTYAAAIAPLAAIRDGGRRGLQLLWITPLRATSADTVRALSRPATDLGWPLRIEARTGDTSSSLRGRQRRSLPEVLVTTPESLSLLLTRPEAARLLGGLRAVVLDEWHELLATKRGSQTELCLARLRRFAPKLVTTALSATLGNLDEAAHVAVGATGQARVVSGAMRRKVTLETLLPPDVDAFPWAGHLGTSMVEPLLDRLDPSRSTLIFTNTRSQAELWHDAIRRARPEWFEYLGLHHGSIDREERTRIEDGLRSGRVSLVVCTASLDLGVDFGPVERVIQIGSPRGIARLLQRAGRAGHRPHTDTHILCVPTHALELAESVAVRRALRAGAIESREPLTAPLDVLAQHLVTCAIGGGFERDAMLAEVREAWSYRELSDAQFDEVLALLEHGGSALEAYPDHHRVRLDAATGRYALAERRKVTWHRLNVGTITSHGSVQLKFLNGRSLGSCEESFIARLRPGESFLFGGRLLEFVAQDGLEVRVRTSKRPTRHTPRWAGGRLPLSACLGAAMRELFEQLGSGEKLRDPELRCAAPVLATQAKHSSLPRGDVTLAECVDSADGAHLFVYPFEGRLVHEGLAALLALRMGRLQKATYSLAVNDYGFEMFAAGRSCAELRLTEWPGDESARQDLFARDALEADVQQAIDLGRLARHQFREVARVAGLVFQNLPGQRRSSRALQASAGLVFDVLERHDPDNLLLHQARREVLFGQFDQPRLVGTLDRIREHGCDLHHPDRFTPLAFPLVVERVRAHVSSESLEDRILRLRNAMATP